MDLDRGPGSISHFSSEPALECSLPLAVSAAHPQYSRRGAGRSAFWMAILLSANFACRPPHRTDLVSRPNRFLCFATPQAVSCARMELSGVLRNALLSARQELLSCANLS